MFCISGAGKPYLKSATYKERFHPDASRISSATQKVQPAGERLLSWQPSMLCLVTLKAGGTLLITVALTCYSHKTTLRIARKLS